MNASRLVIEGCAVATLDPSGSLNAESEGLKGPKRADKPAKRAC